MIDRLFRSKKPTTEERLDNWKKSVGEATRSVPLSPGHPSLNIPEVEAVPSEPARTSEGLEKLGRSQKRKFNFAKGSGDLESNLEAAKFNLKRLDKLPLDSWDE